MLIYKYLYIIKNYNSNIQILLILLYLSHFFFIPVNYLQVSFSLL